MNIAVLSDIHGNAIAFGQVIQYLETREIDAFCILGDYSGEFAGVQETLDLIYALQKKYPVYIVKGNKEDYLMWGLGGDHPEWNDYPSTVGMLRYAYDNMREKDWEFIRTLPQTLSVKFEGMEGLFLCHGSPKEIKGKIKEENENNEELLADVEEKYVLCGHTHKRASFDTCGKHIFNPGAVGNPLDDGRHHCTSFLILHSDGKEWVGEYVYLEQDVDAMVQDMIDHELPKIAPYWAICNEAFFRGADNCNGKVLKRAMEITETETGECDWPAIPEKYWAKAFEEMIILGAPGVYKKMTLKAMEYNR